MKCGPAFAATSYTECADLRVVPNEDLQRSNRMAKSEGEQKGPQKHAEGQHGNAAHAAFIDGPARKSTVEAKNLRERHRGGRKNSDLPDRRGINRPFRRPRAA
jgi:hypothetical protein